MQNKVDFITHKLFEPNYYQRKFESDIPKEPEEETTTQKTKRAFLIALPFLSLYRPFASTISFSMGTLRASTKLIEVFDSQSIPDGAFRVVQLGLATLAIIGTLYNFTLGMLVTTGADLIQSMVACTAALLKADHNLAGEEFLQSLSCTLYLGIMIYGSLEIVIASILMQATVSFYQSSSEYSKGRMPEAMAKFVMGLVRIHQASGQYRLLQRRNALLKQYEAIARRITKGREIDHLWDHPVIRGSMEGQTLEDANGKAYDLGDNFHGVGGQLVKGMNINFRKDGDRKTLQFKINHVFREQLEETLSTLRKTKKGDLQDLLAILGSHAKGIRIEEKRDDITGYFEEYAVHLEGLGKIQFGKTDDVHTLHTRITVDMQDGVNLYDFHEALAFLGLDDALRTSAKEDFERMKLGHLFHMFSPKKATLFVRESTYFDLPIGMFKEEILKRAPEMEAVYDTWLDRLSFRETLPGKMRLWVSGLGDAARDAGARGLTAGLMGAWSSKELNERIASILKMGMISSESRNTYEVNCQGLSWGADYQTGGADSVFTQMVTDKNHSLKEFAYDSNVRIHFSADVFNSGTYQAHYDSYGTRQVLSDDWGWWGDSYLDRPNLPDFIREERESFQYGHEVMVKDRIPPDLITGISVRNQALKDSLIDDLRKRNILELDSDGKERILGKLIDQFIWVGNDIHDEMFA